MIEDYYGHITPAKNAKRILQGIPGWNTVHNGMHDLRVDNGSQLFVWDGKQYQ